LNRRFDHRYRIAGLLPLVLMVASGAGCLEKLRWPWGTNAPPPPPAVLNANPALDDIVRAVNGNSMLVTSMSTNYGTLAAQGAPQLRAALFIEKPGRFRVRGTHALTGPEMDLGSNDEMFWLWIKRAQPPAMYFARHAQAATSGFRQMMPLSPQQLVEAFGIPTFDPQGSHQGPFPQGEGRLAIRSTIAGPDSMLTKTTVVDARTALVVEQQLHSASGQMLATVKTSNHRLDAMSRAWLPHTIELEIPTGNMSMTLNVDRWDVNVPPPADAFVKPEQQGFQNVDVSDPRNLPQAAPLAANGQSQGGVQMASTAPANGVAPVSLSRTRYGEPPAVDSRQDSQWRAVE
jgi:hypothetical protein